MSHLKSIALAATLVVGAVGTAAATEAAVALNVRSGPSTGYGVVDVLYAGETVNIQECVSSGWCAITHNGPDGWVSAKYLTNIEDDRSSDDRYYRDDSRDDVSADINLSFGVPGFSFRIGNGRDFRDRPGRHNGYVCFYSDFDYRGSRFCARPGDADRRLGSFNDRISSIRVIGDAQVKVCEDFNFNGRCAVLDRSRNLTGRNNDIISSYRVR